MNKEGKTVRNKGDYALMGKKKIYYEEAKARLEGNHPGSPRGNNMDLQ